MNIKGIIYFVFGIGVGFGLFFLAIPTTPQGDKDKLSIYGNWKKYSQQEYMLQALKKIHHAQVDFRFLVKNKKRFGTFKELAEANLLTLPGELKTPRQLSYKGYNLTLSLTKKNKAYRVLAKPKPDNKNFFTFKITEEGAITIEE